MVTGAASGIGRETAHILAQAGAKIAVVGRNKERGQACAQRFGVELGDREDADAALMAARAAGQMRAGTFRGGGQRVIDNGEKRMHAVLSLVPELP